MPDDIGLFVIIQFDIIQRDNSPQMSNIVKKRGKKGEKHTGNI